MPGLFVPNGEPTVVPFIAVHSKARLLGEWMPLVLFKTWFPMSKFQPEVYLKSWNENCYFAIAWVRRV